MGLSPHQVTNRPKKCADLGQLAASVAASGEHTKDKLGDEEERGAHHQRFHRVPQGPVAGLGGQDVERGACGKQDPRSYEEHSIHPVGAHFPR
jgi:hypothetical protein